MPVLLNFYLVGVIDWTQGIRSPFPVTTILRKKAIVFLIQLIFDASYVYGVMYGPKEKNSQKLALLPFSSKFGTQDVKRFTQSLSKFERRHLNSAYMNVFGNAIAL